MEQQHHEQHRSPHRVKFAPRFPGHSAVLAGQVSPAHSQPAHKATGGTAEAREMWPGGQSPTEPPACWEHPESIHAQGTSCHLCLWLLPAKKAKLNQPHCAFWSLNLALLNGGVM